LQIAEVFREAIKDKIANNNVITNKIMENYNQFLSNIDELKNFSNNKINNLENSANFMVYHDGYQYFEKFANLEKLDKGAIIYGHHLPGIGQTRKLNNYIKENKISCILVEPGYSKKFINKLHENNNFKTAEIDGEWGPNDVLDKNIYFDMMRSLVNNMTNCITQIQKD
jgi:ABC-type Zn2+ transport system substrate-binding protein/surface adhesin